MVSNWITKEGHWQMGELTQVRTILEEIKRIEHVQDVSLVSRSGMYILGESPKGVHQETYAAMSGILVGAAETTAAEMKDLLRNVMVKLNGRSLLLVATNGRYIFAITTDDKADLDKVYKEASVLAQKADLDF